MQAMPLMVVQPAPSAYWRACPGPSTLQTSAHLLGCGPLPCAVWPRIAVVASSPASDSLADIKERNQDSGQENRSASEGRAPTVRKKHQANSRQEKIFTPSNTLESGLVTSVRESELFCRSLKPLH